MSNQWQHLREIVSRLRGPEGCPWDREQTHESLRAALLEECYEVLNAVDRKDPENLREELGDLLLHVFMHSRIAEEADLFSLEDVVQGLSEKLVRRHPHVFGEVDLQDSQSVVRRWEEIKRQEKSTGESASVMSGVPASLPALLRADKAQKKASRVGFDWEKPAEVVAKVREELEELEETLAQNDHRKVAEEIGDLLFSVANLARLLKLDAELALQAATTKFIERVRKVEEMARAESKRLSDSTPEELDAMWRAVKTRHTPESSPSASRTLRAQNEN